MMGLTHAVSGLAAGCATVALVDGAADLVGITETIPPGPAILAVAITGGAALLPDIDHRSSTVAHALGPLTGLLARATDELSLSIYHATRTPRDPAERSSGHRLVTHTYVGSAVFGLLAAVACLVSAWGAAAVCGLVVGLLGAGTKKTVGGLLRKFLKIRMGAALVLALVGGVSGYAVSEWYPGWWWLYGAAVFLGCVIHREGDWCTNSGVPRRNWPMIRDGRRWDKDRAPATFDTGTAIELQVIRPALTGGFLIAAMWAAGAMPYVWAGVSAVVSPAASGGG